MDSNQNQPADFSDYAPKAGDNNAMPARDLDRENKKRKIQIIIIIAGFILAAGFWGYYFYSQSAKNQAADIIIPAEMIPE